MGKRGPDPRPANELRAKRVSVYFTAAELASLDERRGSLGRGEFLRRAGLDAMLPTIPAINREAWASLARTVGNLNQYQAAINEGRAGGYPPSVLAELRDQVQHLRADLLGIDLVSDEEIEADEDEGYG